MLETHPRQHTVVATGGAGGLAYLLKHSPWGHCCSQVEQPSNVFRRRVKEKNNKKVVHRSDARSPVHLSVSPPHDWPFRISEEAVLLELLHHVLQLRLDSRAGADEDFGLSLSKQAAMATTATTTTAGELAAVM